MPEVTRSLGKANSLIGAVPIFFMLLVFFENFADTMDPPLKSTIDHRCSKASKI